MTRRHTFLLALASIPLCAIVTPTIAREAEANGNGNSFANIDNLSKEQIHRLPPFDGGKCYSGDLRKLPPGEYKRLTVIVGSDVCNPTIILEK